MPEPKNNRYTRNARAGKVIAHVISYLIIVSVIAGLILLIKITIQAILR